MNDYIFFINLVINAIMNPKLLMKHLSTHAILLNNCICCGFIKIDMFMITFVFLNQVVSFSLKITNPKIILEKTIKAHLSIFKLIPLAYTLHFWKHIFSLDKGMFIRSLYTISSSKKVIMNVLLTTNWYVGNPFFMPKGITWHTNVHQHITKEVLYLKFASQTYHVS